MNHYHSKRKERKTEGLEDQGPFKVTAGYKNRTVKIRNETFYERINSGRLKRIHNENFVHYEAYCALP